MAWLPYYARRQAISSDFAAAICPGKGGTLWLQMVLSNSAGPPYGVAILVLLIKALGSFSRAPYWGTISDVVVFSASENRDGCGR